MDQKPLPLKPPDLLPAPHQTLLREKSLFSIDPTNDLLYRTWQSNSPDRQPQPFCQLVVPASLAPDLLCTFHDNLVGGAHMGRNHTFEALR